MRIILFFIDGLGLAAATENNPLAKAEMPCLRRLLGGQPLTLAAAGTHNEMATLLALDATLGVPGEPQSATGQTTLFTGVNAPQAVGRHVRGFPTAALREILAKEGLFKKILALGKTAEFLNSYSPAFFAEFPRTEKRAYSVTTWLNYYAGLDFHTFEDLKQKKAVNADITNELIRQQGFAVPYIKPEEAGNIVAEKSRHIDFVLYEYFLTDIFAHKRETKKIAAILSTIDRFIAGIIEQLDLRQTLFILTSDHGNLEDLTVSTHTLNPVPLLLVGAGRDNLPSFTDLTDVTPFILQRLEGGQ
ncbi:MAG: peptidase [Firmicutes bacterium]|nr:peptidase [Bacillota bacterium]